MWCKIEFTSLFNSNDEVICAMGTLQDISDKKRLEFNYIKMKEQNKLIFKNVKKAFLINVSKEEIVPIDFNGKKDVKRLDYDEGLKKYILNSLHKEDYEKVYEIFAPLNLKKEFINENASLFLEYREYDKKGKIQWNDMVINLIIDPESKDLTGYVYIEEITKKKAEEMFLMNKANRDMLTGLYNRFTTEIIISDILLQRKKDEIHALAILDLDEFKYINDNYGHATGDIVLQGIANSVNEVLEEKDIFGRIGGDEFIILLRDIKKYTELHKKITRIMNNLRKITIDQCPDFLVTASIGVTISKSKEDTYDLLYKKSDEELYKVKKNGKNNYRISDNKTLSIVGINQNM